MLTARDRSEAWRDEWKVAFQLYRDGKWTEAKEALEALNAKAPDAAVFGTSGLGSPTDW